MKKYNLTTGNLTLKLIKFAVPLFISNVLQSLYSIVDMIAVGQFVGSNGLAAISTASMFCFVINSVCIGLTMGGTVLIAQYKGLNDVKAQKDTMGTLLSVSFIAAVIVTIAGLLSYKKLLILLNIPPEAMDYAKDYLKIICMGTVFVFGYNAVCSVLRGLGDSRNPLNFVIVAAVINIVLDIIFIGFMGMATKGAAYATVISQACSLFIGILYLRKKKFISPRSFLMDWDKAKIILKIGVPSVVQLVIVNISFLTITAMLNVYGVIIAAASGVGLKVSTFVSMPCWSLGQAVTTAAAQNIGAGNIKKAKYVTMKGLRITLFSTGLTVLAVQIFIRQIIMLFDTNPDVINEGILYLTILCLFNSFIYCIMYIFDSFATGLGDAVFAMVNAIMEAVVIRIFLCWLFGIYLGYGHIGIYFGMALSPVIPAMAGCLYYYSGVWQKRKIKIGK